MAQVVMKPNEAFEVATPAEIAAILAPPEKVDRVRAPGSVQLDASGSGRFTVYTVPAGSKFELRRIFFSLTGNVAVDPVIGAISLNVAGHWVAYLRSDTLLEFAAPSYGPTLQVPGSQTWGDQQGPEFRNKEVFSIQCAGLVANAYLSVYAEGVLSGPRST